MITVMDEFSFSEWLENAIKERRLRQSDVAEMAGFSRKTISEWMNCKRFPTIMNVNDTMNAFGQKLIAVDKGVDLVRCRDCVYWQDNNDGYPHVGCKWREDETPDPDDFCSAGERRDDDD